MDSLNLQQIKCTYCGEEISHDARRCPYCGSIQNDKGDKASSIDARQSIIQVNENQEVHENTTAEAGIAGVESSGYTDGRIQSVDRTIYQTASSTDQVGLSNGMKVFLTTVSTILPGIGQLIGIIMAILCMNTEDDDKKTFGAALLKSSLAVFVISFLFYFLLLMLLSGYLATING